MAPGLLVAKGVMLGAAPPYTTLVGVIAKGVVTVGVMAVTVKLRVVVALAYLSGTGAWVAANTVVPGPLKVMT